MADRQSLILELESAIHRGSRHKSEETLGRITDLFTGRAEEFTEQHVELFDDVIRRLASEIETKARVELSLRLAPVANAPKNTIRDLASDDTLEVAAPVLLRSPRLDEADLIEIAKNKGQGHLLAIASRRSLGEAVTDVLVDRGDGDVLFNVAANSGAIFSEGGYARLVERAEDDEPLASRIAERSDIPPQLIRKLVMHASGVAQRRLLSQAPADMRGEIESALAKVSREIEPKSPRRNFVAARRMIHMLHGSGALGESELYDLAKSKRYEETVAAMAVLCAAEVEVIDWLMNGDRIEPLLVHLKAAGFDWLTVRAIILLRPSGRRLSAKDLEDICDDFKKLSYATARRVLGHWSEIAPEMQPAS